MGDIIVPQKGGALLGEGTYGCVFTAALACAAGSAKATQPRKGFVGKVSELSDVKEEINAGRRLGKLPEAKRYFVLPQIDSLCVPAPLAQQADPDVKDCDPFQKFGFDGMVQYQMPFGGKSIYDIALEPATFPFETCVLTLLEAGTVLALHNYVHYDLHGGNILFDEQFMPRMIDFGQSFSAGPDITQETLDKRRKIYAPDFGPEPPEVTIITGLLKKIPTRQCIEDVLAKKEGLKQAEQMLGLQRAKQSQEFVKFWSSSTTVRAADWVGFFKLYWPQFDAWAIGAYLVKLLKRLLDSPKFAARPEWQQRREVLLEVMRGLLEMSPRRRLDCVEALALIDPANAVLSSPSGKAWLDARAKMRAQLE